MKKFLGLFCIGSLLMSAAVGQELTKPQNQEAQRLWQEAETALENRQWGQARWKLEALLQIQPHHRKALLRLEELYKVKRNLADRAMQVFNQGRNAEVREVWSQDILLRHQPAQTVRVPSPRVFTRQSDFKIREKLQSIVLEKVEFKDAPLQDAALFLTVQSQESDPENQGVAFLVQDSAKRCSKPATLSLRNVPLGEVLRYLTELAGVRYRIEDEAVLFVPRFGEMEPLVTRDFFVRQQFLDLEKPDSLTVKTALKKRGVAFTSPPEKIVLPDGRTRAPRPEEFSTASYSPATGILTVRNTQDQINYLEQLILSDQEDQGVARLIQVETKILEINQTDLEELGVNWNFNNGLIPGGLLPGGGSGGTQFKLSGVAAQTSLDGANDLPQSNLDNLIYGDQNVSQNQLRIHGLLDGVSFQAVLNALEQKKSVNLVSAPTIVLTAGSDDALIEVVREFIYPTAYDPPQVKLFERNQLGEEEPAAEQIVIPAWPSEFKNPGRKVGVSIAVTQARVDAENQAVALELKPEITEFDGFIDYGSPVLNQANHIRVPVFTVRAFDEGFKVNILDGYTMVLGGLIREELQTIEDKVPFLGDIPLIGELFRSTTERSIRKNLILFVTARILQPNGVPLNTN